MSRQSGHAERRRHSRVPAKIPFHLLTDGNDEPFDLVDLSESGVRIQSPRALVPMTRIRVRMVLPAARVGEPKDLRMDTHGVVVWSHKVPHETSYDVGVFFSELDDRERALLRSYVRSHA